MNKSQVIDEIHVNFIKIRVGNMTKYEFYKKMACKCSDKAVNTGDEVLRKFYQKAEKGFLIKAEKLTLEQAREK